MINNNLDKELETLRIEWGIGKILSPFVARKEVDKFWEKRKLIEELELKLKKLKK